MTEIFVIALINWGFLYFLFAITVVLVLVYVKKITRKDKLKQKMIHQFEILFLFTASGILQITYMINFHTEFNIIEKNDIANWVTLIVGIGIGVIISMSILIYSRHNDDIIIKRNNDEKVRKEQHSREEIYFSLKQIKTTANKREDIRTGKIKLDSKIELKDDIKFMNKQIEKAVSSLQFQLLLHNENLPLSFMKKVRLRSDFLEVNLNRLEMYPQGKFDPKDQCINDLSEFIEKLKNTKDES